MIYWKMRKVESDDNLKNWTLPLPGVKSFTISIATYNVNSLSRIAHSGFLFNFGILPVMTTLSQSRSIDTSSAKGLSCLVISRVFKRPTSLIKDRI